MTGINDVEVAVEELLLILWFMEYIHDNVDYVPSGDIMILDAPLMVDVDDADDMANSFIHSLGTLYLNSATSKLNEHS